jgi:hypothetical protein
MKKCSPSLFIKKMRSKTRLRFNLTPVRMAIIKNTNNNKCWQGCGKEVILIQYWWESKLLQLWKTVRRLLKKIKMELPYDPAILLLWIYLKKCMSVYKEALAHPCLLQHYSQ